MDSVSLGFPACFLCKAVYQPVGASAAATVVGAGVLRGFRGSLLSLRISAPSARELTLKGVSS
jgi:hypothetical protein